MRSLVKAAKLNLFTRQTPANPSRPMSGYGNGLFTPSKTRRPVGKVIFIPMLESTPQMERIGLLQMAETVETVSPLKAVVEHAGTIGIGQLIQDYWHDHMKFNLGGSKNLASFIARSFYPSHETQQWWKARNLKDFFPEHVERVEDGQIPNLLAAYETGYYRLLAEGRVKTSAEPALDFDAWFKYVDGEVKLQVMAPQKFAAGKLEDRDGVFALMEEAAESMAMGLLARDAKLADVCEEETQIFKTNVVVLRGFAHFITLIPILKSRGITVEFSEEFKPYLWALRPIDLVIASGTELSNSDQRNMFLTNIAYNILASGLNDETAGLTGYRKLQETVFDIPSTAVQLFSQELAKDYNEGITQKWVDMRSRFVNFLRSGGINVPALPASTAPYPVS